LKRMIAKINIRFFFFWIFTPFSSQFHGIQLFSRSRQSLGVNPESLVAQLELQYSALNHPGGNICFFCLGIVKDVDSWASKITFCLSITFYYIWNYYDFNECHTRDNTMFQFVTLCLKV
jgi:hypothetical protein